MIDALLLIPLFAGFLAFLLRGDRVRRGLLVGVAVLHAALSAATWFVAPQPRLGGWLALDAPGQIVLTITSVLFLAAAVYAIGYLRRESLTPHEDPEEKFLFSNEPEAVFTGCLLLFLVTMTLIALSQHVGLLWVGIEATTLASAPLIYFHRHHRSLEATWKYLLICSVGIAFALLGNFLLALAAEGKGDRPATLLLVRDLVNAGTTLSAPWLKAAFVFLLVGYGTKMGLAPLHTWLPDAHSEAPSIVSALLSGALLNCAFLGILRGFQVCVAAGLGPFAGQLLIGFGLLSMAVAGCIILGQADYKRMLAYSSVEHVGILALGIGLGGAATFGAFLHAINHSLTKAMLFFLAGNLIAVFRSKSALQVRGILRILPVSGVLWLAGFLAITGSPPFGTFLSEFTILRSALDQGSFWVAALYVAFLGLAFVAMSMICLRMAQGTPPGGWEGPPHVEPLLAIGPPMALGVLVLLLGLYVPQRLSMVLHEAARMLGGF